MTNPTMTNASMTNISAVVTTTAMPEMTQSCFNGVSPAITTTMMLTTMVVVLNQTEAYNCTGWNSTAYNITNIPGFAEYIYNNTNLNVTLNGTLNATYPNCSEPPSDIDVIRSLLVTYPMFWVAVYINNYKYFVLPFFTLIGNLFSFLVMLKRIKTSSSCFYMAMLAICDTVVIWTKAIGLLLDQYDVTDLINDTGCRVLNFILSWTAYIAVWTIVCMTFERFIAVTFPFRASHLCTVKNAVIVFTVLCIVSAALNVHYLIYVFGVYTAANAWTCRLVLPSKEFKLVYTWVDTSVYSFIPLILLFILNTVIITVTSAAARKKAEMTKKKDGDKEKNKQQVAITRQLIIVSVCFTLLTTPYAVLVILEYFVNFMDDPTMFKYVQYIMYSVVAYLMVDLNHSINFFLYCLSGRRFRRDFRNLWVCCRKKRGVKGTFATSRATMSSSMSDSSSSNVTSATKI